MNVLNNRVRATLLDLTSKEGKQLLEGINTLSDIIENKSDPDQNELFILENLYTTFTSLNLLVENLKKYNIGVEVFNDGGSKLSDLFSKRSEF